MNVVRVKVPKWSLTRAMGPVLLFDVDAAVVLAEYRESNGNANGNAGGGGVTRLYRTKEGRHIKMTPDRDAVLVSPREAASILLDPRWSRATEGDAEILRLVEEGVIESV